MMEAFHPLEDPSFLNYGSFPELSFISFNPLDAVGSRKRSLSTKNEASKRRLTEEQKVNVRAVKATGPCLRCKVLKKQVCQAPQICKSKNLISTV
jgi:hypothetical protein